MDFFINALFSVVIVAGIIMTLIGLPGNLLIVLASVAYGYYSHFEHISYLVLYWVIIAFVVSEGIEFMAGVMGAKKEKASKRSMIGTLLGTILGGIGGTLVVPIIGSLVGALLGGFLATAAAEYTKEKNKEQAKRVAISAVKGQLLGIILKVVTGVGMAILLLYHLQW